MSQEEKNKLKAKHHSSYLEPSFGLEPVCNCVMSVMSNPTDVVIHIESNSPISVDAGKKLDGNGSKNKYINNKNAILAIHYR